MTDTISLRDLFAASASERDIREYQDYELHQETEDKVIFGILWETGEQVLRPKYSREQARYRFADAMIAERNKL